MTLFATLRMTLKPLTSSSNLNAVFTNMSQFKIITPNIYITQSVTSPNFLSPLTLVSNIFDENVIY